MAERAAAKRQTTVERRAGGIERTAEQHGTTRDIGADAVTHNAIAHGDAIERSARRNPNPLAFHRRDLAIDRRSARRLDAHAVAHADARYDGDECLAKRAHDVPGATRDHALRPSAYVTLASTLDEKRNASGDSNAPAATSTTRSPA